MKTKSSKQIISRTEYPDYEARREAFKAALEQALVAQGHVPEMAGRGIHSVDGTFVGLDISTSFNRQGYGKAKALRYTVGFYGEKTNCPEPGDGFDVDKAVERVLKAVAANQRIAAENARKDELEKKAKDLLVEASGVLGFEAPTWSDEASGKTGRFDTAVKRVMYGGRVKFTVSVASLEDLAAIKEALEAL